MTRVLARSGSRRPGFKAFLDEMDRWFWLSIVVKAAAERLDQLPDCPGCGACQRCSLREALAYLWPERREDKKGAA
jgi:hypothetical protein